MNKMQKNMMASKMTGKNMPKEDKKEMSKGTKTKLSNAAKKMFFGSKSSK